MIGFVSDENDVAVPGVHVLVECGDGTRMSWRSDADGGIALAPPLGEHRVTLARDGFGSKRVDVSWQHDSEPLRFRILRDTPSAYMWPKWSRSGERSVPRVHAVESYHASIWRYGSEREHLFDIDWVDEHGPRANMQITPDGDYTQTGVAWNTVGYGGNDHHARSVVAPERSGLYFLHIVDREGRFTSAPWIVAPETPQQRIAVLAGTNTWNAYNEFGGRSNYLNPTRIPDRPTVNARQDMHRFNTEQSHPDWKSPDTAYAPLTFERPEPFNVIPLGQSADDMMHGYLEPSLVAAEWRMLAWLERQGFASDVYADAQLHDGTLDLGAYEVLILSGHPEYWSREMIERVEAWLDAGGRLLSLGGNSLNCEVEFVDQASLRFLTYLGAGGPDLGMPNPDDPDHPFDSRLHRTLGRSEASLLGTATTIAGFGTGAPYEVIAADHWVFEGLDLQPGDLFGEQSLSGRCSGASGWETDKRTPSTPEQAIVLARGKNSDEGGAEMLFLPVGRGGAVISAGSITYAASLLVDERLSAVTANMVRRFLDPRPLG